MAGPDGRDGPGGIDVRWNDTFMEEEEKEEEGEEEREEEEE